MVKHMMLIYVVQYIFDNKCTYAFWTVLAAVPPFPNIGKYSMGFPGRYVLSC